MTTDIKNIMLRVVEAVNGGTGMIEDETLSIAFAHAVKKGFITAIRAACSIKPSVQRGIITFKKGGRFDLEAKEFFAGDVHDIQIDDLVYVRMDNGMGEINIILLTHTSAFWFIIARYRHEEK